MYKHHECCGSPDKELDYAFVPKPEKQFRTGGKRSIVMSPISSARIIAGARSRSM